MQEALSVYVSLVHRLTAEDSCVLFGCFFLWICIFAACQRLLAPSA